MNKIDTTLLDGLIVGRIDPHIYAFTTNTVPNYLKVGDTYRPVNVRLNEWREHFPNLHHESKYIYHQCVLMLVHLIVNMMLCLDMFV